MAGDPLSLEQRCAALLAARDSYAIAFLNLSTAKKVDGADVPQSVLVTLQKAARTIDQFIAEMGGEVATEVMSGDMGAWGKGGPQVDPADMMMPGFSLGSVILKRGAALAARVVAKRAGTKAATAAVSRVGRSSLRGSKRAWNWVLHGGNAGAPAAGAAGVRETMKKAFAFSTFAALGYFWSGPLSRKLNEVGMNLMPLIAVGVGIWFLTRPQGGAERSG